MLILHCFYESHNRYSTDIPQFPEELSLVQTKVVSLIQLNQIEDAYNFILKNESSQ